jgi:mannose-6-phosphate isomerase
VLPLLKFSPVLLAKPWGGDALWRLLGKGSAIDDRMGESWELSDRPEAPTPVAEGPLAGKTITEILAGHAVDLMGNGVDITGPKTGNSSENTAFPLLYKFIGAREKLSVQVHPGAGSPLGEAKTECWYVVHAEPNAALIVGVHPDGRSRDETLALLKSPECESVLQRLPARRGDVFLIPAGTVHAITEGLLLYELQQNSDTTFRLYDWGRVDAQGKPRALHIAEATAVADTEARTGYRIPPVRVTHASHLEEFLVACPYFALKKWTGFQKPVTLETNGRFRVLTALAGTVTVHPSSGVALPVLHLSMGETALIPACHDSVRIEASSDAELLISFIPDSIEEVRGPLRAAGHAPAVIDALFGPTGFHS